MPNFSTNEFKPGLKVMLDGDPCSILENEFVKPLSLIHISEPTRPY